MNLKTLSLAAGALLISSGIAAAAVVSNDLNLRSGPGTGYRVVDTMPAGAYVNVLGCTGSWCRVNFQGRTGYASANYLDGGGRGAYAAAPVYVAPPPAVSFGFGFGNGPRWHNDRNHWRGRHDRDRRGYHRR